MEKYLKINNDPNIEGDFVETTDTNSPFVVVDFQEQAGEYWSNLFKLDFRCKSFNEEIRELCNSKYINITNADIIPLEKAIGINVSSEGRVLFHKKKNLWIINININIYIELIGPLEENKCIHNYDSSCGTENEDNVIVNLNTNLCDATSETTNIVSWEFDASSIQKNQEYFNQTTVQRKSEKVSETEENEKQILDRENIIDTDNSETIHFDSIQYLISGHDGETFFFDGSPTNKTGASFKIEYDSKTMKGEFSLIVDFNNLKVINAGFRRCVIKMINNEASIKEASSFIMIEKGQAHYSEQDKVWMVDKPLVIKLLK